jgi:hypothetical protein
MLVISAAMQIEHLKLEEEMLFDIIKFYYAKVDK